MTNAPIHCSLMTCKVEGSCMLVFMGDIVCLFIFLGGGGGGGVGYIYSLYRSLDIFVHAVCAP